MTAHDKFRRFRLNVLSFLRLPLDTREAALRQAIGNCSAHLLQEYLWRSQQALPKPTPRPSLPSPPNAAPKVSADQIREVKVLGAQYYLSSRRAADALRAFDEELDGNVLESILAEDARAGLALKRIKEIYGVLTV